MDSFFSVEQKNSSFNYGWVLRFSRLVLNFLLMAIEDAIVKVIILHPSLIHLMPWLHTSICLVHHSYSLLLRFPWPCFQIWVNSCRNICFGHKLRFRNLHFYGVPLVRRVIVIRFIKLRVTAQVRIVHFSKRKVWLVVVIQAFAGLFNSILIKSLLRLAQLSYIKANVVNLLSKKVMPWLNRSLNSLDFQYVSSRCNTFQVLLACQFLSYWQSLSHGWWAFLRLVSPAWLPS